MPRKLSRRASRIWERLGQWYGSRLADAYGPTPPEDWAELIDRTDDERLEIGLVAVRRATPVFPPTLGQLEAAIPKRESLAPNAPSRAQMAADAMMAKYGKELCKHQLAGRWTYFGPVQDFPNKHSLPEIVQHPLVRGVHVDPCSQCDKPSRRVTIEQNALVAA